MDNAKAKILVLVEGAKTDVKLLKHLLSVYGIDQSHQIISYNTNIYSLYNLMFRNTNPDDVDILQLLKEHETVAERKAVFDERYSDILLIFDLDPQDPQFSSTKITEMMNYFVESSDMGKLYLNYPMVESFYHMKSIPDDDYWSYTATMQELSNHIYKSRVAAENRNHDYSKFAVNKSECNIVIKQNILSFLYEEKYIKTDISLWIPTANHGRAATLPNIWTQDDIERLLSSVDRANPIGKRDYAILLLAARLGLRDSDVQNLTFSNILWKECRISLVQTKTKRALDLPITEEIGNAIIEYLKYGRPKHIVSDYIFVRHSAPYDKSCFHTFFRYIQIVKPELSYEAQIILGIPFRKSPKQQFYT